MSQTNGKNRNAPYWHDRQLTGALGCLGCHDRKICGGVNIEHAAFDCTAFCQCDAPSQCNFVCPRNPQNFVARIREVQGLTFDSVGNAPQNELSDLPSVIPMIYGKTRRERPVAVEYVGLPLLRLFSKKTGKPLVSDCKDLADRFRYSASAKLLLVGVDFDDRIESYWSIARRESFVDFIVSLKPALVTTPNFSLFGDVPRWDNLHNMKRIAVCWHELADRRIPTALHVNARTDTDYRRWTEFLRSHPEIDAIAFDFSTGPASPKRSAWHAMKLADIAESLPRSVRLVLRGGRPHLRALTNFFVTVTYVATDPYMRTIRRRRLTWRPGRKERWNRSSRRGLDALLQHNIDEHRRMIIHRLAGGAVQTEFSWK